MRALLLIAVLAFGQAEEEEDKPKAPSTPFMKFGGTMKCPQGTRPVESAGGRQRCVADRSAPNQPAALKAAPAILRPPMEKVLDAQQGPAKAVSGVTPTQFDQVRLRGLRLEVPKGWHRVDAWNDEEPTLLIEEDPRRPGKRVTMSVSRVEPKHPDYETIAQAVAKEKEYQKAAEGPRLKVSGLAARQTVVDGESRAVFVDSGAGSYYTLTYSSPPELFDTFEPAFERLLSTARLGGGAF